MIKIPVKDQNLIAIDTMYKKGFLTEMGLLNLCVIRFTNEVEGNNFSILIYHSKNKRLKQQAEEVSFQIMSKCEKSEK